MPCRRLGAHVCWWFLILPQQARWWSAKSQCVYIILIQFHFNLFKLHLCLFLFFSSGMTLSVQRRKRGERWQTTLNEIVARKFQKKSYIYHTLSSSEFLVSFSCRNPAVWAASSWETYKNKIKQLKHTKKRKIIKYKTCDVEKIFGWQWKLRLAQLSFHPRERERHAGDKSVNEIMHLVEWCTPTTET